MKNGIIKLLANILLLSQDPVHVVGSMKKSKTFVLTECQKDMIRKCKDYEKVKIV